MKYLVLIAGDEARWDATSPEDRQAVMDAHTAFHKAVAERATMLAGEALTRAHEARTLRHADGEQVVTEGPYAEGVEQLGGFYLVEAGSMDEMLDLCRILPTTSTMEVRPVIDLEGYEDTRDWA